MPLSFDYALIGGGLQNGLIALALRHRQPQASILLVERDSAIGGNHTWCLHDGDVAPAAMAWLAPLLVHRWPSYDVHFTDLDRHVALGYAAITSERFAAIVHAAMAAGPGAVWLNATARDIGAQHVTLTDGRHVRAKVVIAALGPDEAATPANTGWQKFLGLEIATRAPHGLQTPILMDARVPQVDGFRFLYVLPLDPHRLLVEDTVFSDRPHLAASAMRANALAYAAQRGWEVAAILREERGVLPMPWTAPPLTDDPRGPVLAGMQGGWVHPATGYSLAVAARLADWLACVPPDEARGPGLQTLRARHADQASFARKLNWALFRMAAPAHRNTMMSRFYRRPDEVIRRFFALDMHLSDRLRIVLGAPPRKMNLWPRSSQEEVNA